MSVLNQVDYYRPTSMKMLPDRHQPALAECGRLIHAAVISKRFLSTLLANPIKSIEGGFCGEKFSFSREEKQQIKQIRASSLAEFSTLLLQAVNQAGCIAPSTELAFAQLETRPEISA